VITGAALLAMSAQAQFSGTYTDGDFLLGFRATGGQGAANDILVDLGQINFSTTTTFSTPNLDSLLTSNFGSNWFTRADLLFGAAARAQSGDSNTSTTYGTSPETVGGSEAILWPEPTGTQANQLKGKISGEGGAYQNAGPTMSAPAISQLTSATNSYGSYQPGGTTANSNGISYAYFNPDIEASNPSASTLDVIQLVPTTGGPPGVDVGDLTIDSSGNVKFTPDSAEMTVVPEPSVTALVSIAVVGMILFCLRRRIAKAS